MYSSDLHIMAKPIVLRDYHVSNVSGFLLENPQEGLPEYFHQWNRLVRLVPGVIMMEGSEFRKSVQEMAVLDYRRLSGHRQHRLARLQLGVIAATYVWVNGQKGVTKRLPECLAVPLWGVSSALGLNPIVSYADLCLANWKLSEEGSMECLYQLPGGTGSRWFFQVTCGVEMALVKGLVPLQSILDGLANGREAQLTSGLVNLAVAVNSMTDSLNRMHENLSAGHFYNVLRPFFAGWGGYTNPLPDGLIYEGVSEQPVKMRGITAAHNPAMQMFDVLLGVSHQPDKRAFMKEMREYMLPCHRQLLEDLEAMPRKLHQIIEGSDNEELIAAYNACLESVTKFRNVHIQMVAKYIIAAPKRATEDDDFLFNIGTGGSDLMPFLRQLRDDTKEKMHIKVI